MFADYKAKFGKLPTEVKVGPELYDSLKAELLSQLPPGMTIDFICLHGIVVERHVLH